jgi:hypothetical protein
MRSIRTTTARRAIATALLAATLAAPAVPRPVLAQQEEPDPHRQAVVGGAVGALGGAVLGRLLAGRHNNTAAVLGGAILGGLAGGAYGYSRERQGLGGAQAADDYQRQSDLQRREAARQDEERKLYDGWKDRRTAAGDQPKDTTVAKAGDPEPTPPAATGPRPLTTANLGNQAAGGTDQVATAQRMLKALDLYKGPVDGKMGEETRDAVMRFQSAKGLPPTGEVNAELIDKLRASL